MRLRSGKRDGEGRHNMAFEALSIAASSLRASRVGMEIASQNLAGANDPNYSVQTANSTALTSSPSSRYGMNLTYQGVNTIGIQRARVNLLDQNYRQQNETQQSLSSAQTYLTNLQSSVTGSGGIATLYTNASSALATLQGNSGDAGLRNNAMQSLQQLAGGFNNASSAIASTTMQAKTDMTSQVESVNSDLAQLASLNSQIAKAGSNNSGLNQILDQRDQILDHLSGSISTQVVQQSNGTVNIYSHGTQLLQFNNAEKLSVDSSDNIQTSAGLTLSKPGGSVGGLQTLVQSTLPGYQQQYDTLATSVMTKLNAIHSASYGSDGVTGRALFSGTGAADLAVSLTDPSQLATAVARIDGNTISSSTGTLASDQSLSSQASQLATPAATSGVISVNGTNISWNDSQSVNDLVSKFSAAGVKASYNSQTQSLSLSRDPTVAGASSISITDVSGNLTSVLGLNSLTSSPGGSGDNQGAVALSQGFTSTTYGSGGSQSFLQAAQAIPLALGQYISATQSSLKTAQAGLTAADNARSSVSGVNSDEELLQLTKQQNAYQMAAKVATAADDMLSTLIKM